MGCYWLTIKPHYVDYSKYLGPEFTKEKATYGKAGIVCSNHINWIDPFIHTIRQMPAAVVKADIVNIPLVGPLGLQTGCMYFDRGSKDEKRDLLSMTKER